MTKFVRSTRRMTGPALTVAALALTAQAAFAVGDGNQAKPSMKIEAERSPQGARLTFLGKGWPAAARVKVTATRAPGSNTPQDFGMFSADSSGNFTVRKVAGCTTNQVEDTRESVTFTSADSATGTKVTTKVEGAAWQCM